MNDLDVILSLTGTVFGLLVTATTFIIKNIKNKNAKRLAEQVLKVANVVVEYVKEAEKFPSYSGEEKRAYVMTKTNQFTIENRLSFDKEQVSNKIEELISLTKEVNVQKAKGALTERSWL